MATYNKQTIEENKASELVRLNDLRETVTNDPMMGKLLFGDDTVEEALASVDSILEQHEAKEAQAAEMNERSKYDVCYDWASGEIMIIYPEGDGWGKCLVTGGDLADSEQIVDSVLRDSER